jgi:hypothetical protein
VTTEIDGEFFISALITMVCVLRLSAEMSDSSVIPY